MKCKSTKCMHCAAMRIERTWEHWLYWRLNAGAILELIDRGASLPPALELAP